MARLFTRSFRITLLAALLAAGAMSLAPTHARPVTRVEASVARQAPPAVSRSEFFRPGVDVAAGQMCNWAGTWTGTDGPQTLTMTVSSGVGTVRGRWSGWTSSDATSDSFQGTARGDGTHLDSGTWYNGNHGGTMDYTMAADCNSFSGNRYECYQGGAASVPAGQSGPQAPRFCSSGNYSPDSISYQRSSGTPTVPIAASSTGGSTNTNTGSTGSGNTGSTGSGNNGSTGSGNTSSTAGTTATNCNSGFTVGVANPGCPTGATSGQQQPAPCSFNNPRNAAGNCPTPVPCLVDNSMHTPPNDPCPQGPLPACPGGVLRNADGTCPPPPPCPGGVARNPDGSCPQGTLCLDMVTTIYPPKTTDDCPKGTPCPDLVTTIYPTNPAQTCPPGTLCPDNATTIYPNNPLSAPCPAGTPCFDGSRAYSTAIPPQTCPSGAPPTINSISCTPAEFSLTPPAAQSVICTADVSADPSSPVTSWSWTDTSSSAAGVGSPNTGADPAFNLTFSQAVPQSTRSVANLTACGDQPSPVTAPSFTGTVSTCANSSATITIDPAPGSCRVEVKSRPVAASNGVGDHLLIVYTDKDGKQTVFEGGPEPDSPDPADPPPGGLFGFGQVTAGSAPYRTAAADANIPTVTVAFGTDACDDDRSFSATVTAINSHPTAYQPISPLLNTHNSNSVAYTLLYYAAIAPQKPDGTFTPGWGNLLNIGS